MRGVYRFRKGVGMWHGGINEKGAPKIYINLIQYMYEGSSTSVKSLCEIRIRSMNITSVNLLSCFIFYFFSELFAF